MTQKDPPQRPQRFSDHAELDRIRRVYANRSARRLDRRYELHRPETLLALQQLERALLTELAARGRTDLGELDILDVGCGSGGMLLRLLSYGASPTRIHGVDLLEDMIGLARVRLPSVDLRVGNAAHLPHGDDSIDIVVQFTMLSSIIDAGVRAKVAMEMSRVVRPEGIIVSYDFWVNPRNRDTHGVTRRQLRALFPLHRIDARSATLAPPIARLVAPWSYGVAAALQALPPLRTHVLAIITPPKGRSAQHLGAETNSDGSSSTADARD